MLTDFNFKEASTYYQKGYPFPHIIIDNFLKDTAILNEVVNEFQTFTDWGFDNTFKEAGWEINKEFYPWDYTIPPAFPKYIKRVIDYFYSFEFLEQLNTLTGIQLLIPDENFFGGGMHRVHNGGRLGIHADYNKHPINKQNRRLNLLLYLNEGWESDWGGQLEFWDKPIKNKIVTVKPILNRVVIFNTLPTSFHGHPKKITCPENTSRKAIALYYFTKEKPENQIYYSDYLEFYNTPEDET
jgi:Rps23 Pro-64 3,4-dihydroxylase Tpa1-like proline 4-hydroxylase